MRLLVAGFFLSFPDDDDDEEEAAALEVDHMITFDLIDDRCCSSTAGIASLLLPGGPRKLEE